MSRSFNGGVAADGITFAVGSAPPDEGPITMAVLAKAANTAGFTGWAMQGRNGSSGVWAILTTSSSGPKLFIEGDFTTGVSGLTTSWAWYVVTKAAGSSIPRWHVGTLTGGSISWVHTDASGTVPDGSGPITSIVVGGNLNAAQTWRGSIAVAAAKAATMTDLAVEAAFTLAASALLAATPDWMVRLNQASTATAVSDDTGNGGDQTALAGTAVDADDPPGFDYTLSGSTTSVTSDLDIRWSIAAPVTSDLDIRWAIRSVVTSDLDIRWGIGGTVISDLDIRWRILATVSPGEGAQYEIGEIMDALAATFDGVETGDMFGGVPATLSASAEMISQVNVPAMVFELDSQEYDLEMGSGADSLTIIALALVEYVDTAGSQRALWRFLSRKSTSGIARLKAELEANQDLGGLVSYAIMQRVRQVGIITYGGIDYLGAEIVIEVVS